jgi:hypothetical protein
VTAPSLRPEIDPRDGVLAVLSDRLRGPRRVREDLLTEVRDGLDDATDDLLASGLGTNEARDRAVAEFGDPVGLARELQAELTGVQARRTALAVAVVSPLLNSAWSWGYPAMMRDYWMRGGHPTGSQLLITLNTIQDIAVWTVTPLLLLAYLMLRRRTVVLPRAALLIGSLAVGLLGVNLLTSGLMTAFNPDLVAALQGNLPGWILQVGSVAALLFLVLSTARTVRLLAFAARPLPHRE